MIGNKRASVMRGQLEHPVDGIIPWNVRNSNWLLPRELVTVMFVRHANLATKPARFCIKVHHPLHFATLKTYIYIYIYYVS